MEKRFISEKQLSDIAETRRQERGGEDAAEAPYDPRSLYERLQEQKDKKQAEHDELHAHKNQVSRITEDEALFLEELSERRAAEERARLAEDRALIDAYHQAVQERAKGGEPSAPSASAPVVTISVSVSSSGGQQRTSAQRSLIARAVKRKAPDDAPPPAPPPPPSPPPQPQLLLPAYGTDSSESASGESSGDGDSSPASSDCEGT